MIVFDLRCGGGHVFEAWFGSTGSFEAQRAAGQVRCPLCDDRDVAKAAMAPNIAAKGNRTSPPPAAVKQALAAVAAAQADMLSRSQWVGRSFARRARAMHDGAEDRAPIHGQASLAEAKELMDDGVAVTPLPLPIVPPEAAN